MERRRAWLVPRLGRHGRIAIGEFTAVSLLLWRPLNELSTRGMRVNQPLNPDFKAQIKHLSGR